MPPRWSTRNSRVALGVTAALLVVALAVAVAVGAGREPSRLEPGSPEAAVQTFVEALIDRRWLDARAQLTDELAARCAPTTLADHGRPDVARVVLVDAAVAGQTATVELDITESYGEGLFDGGESTFAETFVLTRADDGWRIAEAPWPLYGCMEGLRP